MKKKIIKHTVIISTITLAIVLTGAMVLIGCPDTNSGGGNAPPTYPYVCENGVAAPGRSATEGTERCATCASGHALDTDRSCKFGYSFVCANGIAALGVTNVANVEQCAQCNNGFNFASNGVSSCLPVGSAFAIGSETQFGVGESAPAALAADADGDVLYMLGDGRDLLYTVDTTTGKATAVDASVNAFGISESRPGGLAFVADTLYMIGNDRDTLYVLNPTTGMAGTSIGDPGEVHPSGLAAIGDTLYMVGEHGDRLSIVATTSPINLMNVGPQRFGQNEHTPKGIAAIGDTLYMVGARNDWLYTVDTTTGIATRIGSVDKFGVGEDTPSGLTVIGDTLYMVGATNAQLYTLVLP